jgi:hypothetical protein
MAYRWTLESRKRAADPEDRALLTMQLRLSLAAPACAAAAIIAAISSPLTAAARDDVHLDDAAAVGFDISFPQCGQAFPSGAAFTIVGVNGGRPYDPNPCLGNGAGASELAWAGQKADLYANTADPGPELSSHWPDGQSEPRECNTPSNSGRDTPECHYDYGWNAATDSYRQAVEAERSLEWIGATATRTIAENYWWLDVENENSWTSDPSRNVAALTGETDFFRSVGVAGIGFDSNDAAWGDITGHTTAFSSYPSWTPGATSAQDAETFCGRAGLTLGGIAIVQFPTGGFDGDIRCALRPSLLLQTTGSTTHAGAVVPLGIRLSAAAASSATIALSSSSRTGRFATSAGAVWSRGLSLTLAGSPSGQTLQFLYRDTRAGRPKLTARSAAAATVSVRLRLRPASIAHLALRPSRLALRIGQRRQLKATAADRYGNVVIARPTWGILGIRGMLRRLSPSRVLFVPETAGTGSIRVRIGRLVARSTVVVK